MALPIRATLEDINQTCVYLSSKPTGASLKDIASVVGEKTRGGSRHFSLGGLWKRRKAEDTR